MNRTDDKADEGSREERTARIVAECCAAKRSANLVSAGGAFSSAYGLRNRRRRSSYQSSSLSRASSHTAAEPIGEAGEGLGDALTKFLGEDTPAYIRRTALYRDNCGKASDGRRIFRAQGGCGRNVGDLLPSKFREREVSRSVTGLLYMALIELPIVATSRDETRIKIVVDEPRVIAEVMSAASAGTTDFSTWRSGPSTERLALIVSGGFSTDQPS